jgi:hypothetical protein
MRSVFYRGTGRFTNAGQKPDTKAGEIVRNNEIHAPEFLGSVGNRSLFVGGDRNNGIDQRLNAVGDSADIATGYQIVTDTLTFIKKQVSEQKFYKVAPADYFPVVVGDGAFSANLLTNRTYMVSEDFEAGNIRTGTGDTRLSMSDVAIDGVNAYVQNWAKGISYSLFDVEQALRANNWDPIQGKHESRKKNWDLGIQLIAFLGSATDTRIGGLLTLSGITTNLTRITKLISTMTAAELQVFVAGMISDYFAATGSTAMPNRFVIPYADYLGMQVLTPGTVGTYPVPLISYLEEAFKKAVAPMESEFKIIPLAYCDAATNNTLRGINKNIYMLYRNDPQSVRMDIPVDFTTTQANSLNNFEFQDVGYGQYTGCVAYRNLEALKFQF